MRFSGFGPYFEITEYAGSAPDGGGWRPLAELATDPIALAARIETVRATLTPRGGRPVERRPVASAVLLGLAARLLSPALAGAVVAGRLLDLRLARLYWRPSPSSAFPLAVPADSLPAATDLPAGLADLISGPIGQLVTTTRAACSLSPLVAWDNVGSALNGAAIVIGQQRPELADRTYRLTSAVLARPPLGMPDPVAGPSFRRTSCCLLYRIAGRAAVCADCVLVPRLA
ncbi:MAG TPA: (2Fe-2S)-binding protein [Jatrophihabitans sp.]|nr:(2Fe-2S)-binding protein [Jatrophihabitans sp.]